MPTRPQAQGGQPCARQSIVFKLHKMTARAAKCAIGTQPASQRGESGVAAEARALKIERSVRGALAEVALRLLI